jgi:hypothetical protein
VAVVFRAVALVLALAVFAEPGVAGAKPEAVPRANAAFTSQERDVLLAGGLVSRPVRFARGVEGFYVGGISYQIVQATPAEVMAALVDVDGLPNVLPRTKRAALVPGTGTRARVDLVQGGGMFEAKYTVHVEQSPDRDELRFWMDPSRPHDVKDVWGFFRVRPFGTDHSLVTVGAVLDLGPGIVRALFEDKIQDIILSSPATIKRYVEPRAFASNR